MRALQLAARKPLTALALADLPDLAPGPAQIVIRLKAAALNHRDLYVVQRDVQPPCIPGSDGAGVVEAVGEGVTGWQAGDEAVIYPVLGWGEREDTYGPDFQILGVPTDGTLAERIVVPAANVYRKPAHLSFAEAAALPLAGLTAYRALFVRAKVEPGERVLITGIGGGVALFALHIAKAHGAQVAVTSRQDDKLARAHKLGAEFGVNSQQGDWIAEVRKWSGGAGVDVVVESIGGEMLGRSLETLRMGGRLVTFGRSGGAAATLDVWRVFWHHLSILGSTMGSPADFAAMLDLVSQHQIRPVIDSVRPLAEVSEAFRQMEAMEQFGKLVLDCEGQ